MYTIIQRVRGGGFNALARYKKLEQALPRALELSNECNNRLTLVIDNEGKLITSEGNDD